MSRILISWLLLYLRDRVCINRNGYLVQILFHRIFTMLTWNILPMYLKLLHRVSFLLNSTNILPVKYQTVGNILDIQIRVSPVTGKKWKLSYVFFVTHHVMHGSSFTAILLCRHRLTLAQFQKCTLLTTAIWQNFRLSMWFYFRFL